MIGPTFDRTILQNRSLEKIDQTETDGPRKEEMDIHKIAIMGAGHGGLAAAADLTKRGFDVRLHARREESLAPIRAQANTANASSGTIGI